MAFKESLTEAEQKFFDSKGEIVPGEKQEETKQVELPLGEAKTEAKIETPAPVETKTEMPPAEVKTEAKEPEPAKAILSELQEERKKRQEERKKREEAEKNYTVLDTRLKTLLEIAKSQQPPSVKDNQIEVPDIGTDPVGHFRAQNEILMKQIKDHQDWREQQEKTSKEREQQQTAMNNVQQLAQVTAIRENEFRQTNKDYDDAITFLKQMREAQLIAMGYDDAVQRTNIATNDYITMAAQALSTNRNPAEVFYSMAKASGWKPKEGTTTPVLTASATPPPTATQTPNPPSPAPVITEEKKVEMASKGQKSAGTSLSQIAGAASPPLTLESLAKMPDDEFAKLTQGRNWRKLMS